jgi:hypothetical protein
MFWSAALTWMLAESNLVWSNQTVIEMVLLALEPVIVFLKSIKVEAINRADTLALRNLQEDPAQVQELIRAQVQLRQG